MGLFFSLEVECGSAEWAAAVAEHFSDYSLQLADGLRVMCSSGAKAR